MPSTLGEGRWCDKHHCDADNGCPTCGKERDDATRSDEDKKVAEWLRSADAGAMFGSTTWGLRQQLARGIEEGLHRDWRSRVDSTY